MKFDYVFIGAGPASLAAANYFLELGNTNILILEEGKDLKNRFCPSQLLNSCTKCSGSICQNTSGEGGSSAIYGNKLCYLPASNRLLDYVSETTLSESNKYLDNILNPHYESNLNKSNKTNNFRKVYSSEILYKNVYSELIIKLLFKPKLFDILKCDTKVTEIVLDKDNIYNIITNSGLTIKTKSIILGCGRTSHSFLRETYKKMRIAYEENSPDIGIRIEAPSSSFSKKFFYQNDPKIKKHFMNIGSARTFCACKGGLIIPVKYGDSYYADGVFGESDTEYSNVAFMARSNRPISKKVLESWCVRVNKISKNQLLLGSIHINSCNYSRIVEQIISIVPSWPTFEHKYMINELLKISLNTQNNMLKYRGDSFNLRIFGPAIDLYWPKPILSFGFQTSLRNFYVIGDATGISRGIVQAMIGGVSWAINQNIDAIKREYKKTIITNESDYKIWSISA